MCSSCFRSGSVQVLQSQGFDNIIPSETFMSDITYSDFMVYKCMNEDKFFKALSTIRIDKNTTLDMKVRKPEDVKKLAVYADKGEDKIKWGVSIKKLLGDIDFTDDLKKSQTCKLLAFSKD